MPQDSKPVFSVFNNRALSSTHKTWGLSISLNALGHPLYFFIFFDVPPTARLAGSNGLGLFDGSRGNLLKNRLLAETCLWI